MPKNYSNNKGMPVLYYFAENKIILHSIIIKFSMKVDTIQTNYIVELITLIIVAVIY